MNFHFAYKKEWGLMIFILALQFLFKNTGAQNLPSNIEWIRPANDKAPSVWGIKNGIIFGLWPFSIETGQDKLGGGPRGLIRVGYEFEGNSYLINFIAIEPVVNGKMEFSEISPSKVDGQWGKLLWAANEKIPGKYYPAAITPGTITHPDPDHQEVEQLSVFVYMEQYLNGAYPYFKISIRSDHPEEMGIEIFNQKNSTTMERCALTATMGNYSRLRLLYLKNQVIDSRKLYKGFDDIGFVEKEDYPADQMLKDNNGNFFVLAASDESFDSLSAWPQSAKYFNHFNWHYRPFFKVTQYWRKENSGNDSTLRVRVNGRAKY